MQEEHQRKKITLKEIGIKNLCLLFGAGLVLVLASTMKIGRGKEDKKPTVNQVSVTEQTDALEQYTKELENRLTSILSRVEGVGKVEVMITLKSSKEAIVNKDNPSESSDVLEQDKEGGKRQSKTTKNQEETILVGENGAQTPYVVKELEPEIAGVVVIAEGGENQKVINDITTAVEALFSVPTHKIKILKMEMK